MDDGYHAAYFHCIEEWLYLGVRQPSHYDSFYQSLGVLVAAFVTVVTLRAEVKASEAEVV
jgi:hypothetical protein